MCDNEIAVQKIYGVIVGKDQRELESLKNIRSLLVLLHSYDLRHISNECNKYADAWHTKETML